MYRTPIETLGACAQFQAMQAERLQRLGIDRDGLEISHLAFRTEMLAEYLPARKQK